MTRRALAPFVALLALTTAAVAAASPGTDWVAYYHEHVARFRAENAALDPAVPRVVLVGDSLTEGWSPARIRRFLPTLAPRVLNRGISSDGVGVNDRGVLHRLDESVFDCHPSHVVLCIGVNDIGRDGHGVERAARALGQVVQAIRARLPRVPLILVTLAPARGAAAAFNPPIVAFNERVRALAHDAHLPLIDLFPLVADDHGELPEAMAARDGLHWKDGVYEVLGRELERVVAGSAGESR
jgi:lysophospholipase L1-like esterase